MPNRVEISELIKEYEEDLNAFTEAYDILEKRARLRSTDFVEWPGYLAAKNVMIMSIVRLEGLLEDLRSNLTRRGALRLIQENDDVGRDE